MNGILLIKLAQMKKIIYWLLLTVTVLIIALFAGLAVWCCVYHQFFYTPPAEMQLPATSISTSGSSGIMMTFAAFAGFLGSGLIYHLDDGDSDRQDRSGGAE